MGIDAKHPSYVKFQEDWEMLRDFYAGPQQVKLKGEKYLAPTEGMRIDGLEKDKAGWHAYNAYRNRARVPDYVKEAVEVLVGLLHQKEAIIELPTEMEYLRERASANGEPLNALHRRINVEQISTGRLGLLVDMRENPDPAHPNPYIALYTAESLINWDDNTETDEYGKLNLVVLDESGHKRVNIFDWKDIKKYRVLELGAPAENEQVGVYKSATFTDEGTLTYNADDMKSPMLRGGTLDFIPFTFINSKDLLAEPDEPPLKGLAEMCKGIYQSEADYRQNLYMQAQDTLVVIGGVKNPTGLPGEPEALRTGAGARIDVDTGGDAKYIGVSADGLTEQRMAIEADRKRAQVKAGELIQNTGSQMESGQALSTRFNAQTATLNQMATTAAAGLEMALRQIAKWMNLDTSKVKVTPNTEFIDFALDGANFKAIMEAKEMGFPISEESLHALAADRGLTVMDFVTEMKKVEEDRKAAQKRKEDAMKMESELAPKAAAPGAPGAAPPAQPAKPPAQSGGNE